MKPQSRPRSRNQRALVETAYQAGTVEEVVAIKEELTERVDSYLEYVADEWFQENALQVEHGLKTEITESFLEGMKSLFEEHYVTIPEDRYDVIESMVDKLDEMEINSTSRLIAMLLLIADLLSLLLMLFSQKLLKVLQHFRRRTSSLLSLKMLSLKVKQTIVRNCNSEEVLLPRVRIYAKLPKLFLKESSTESTQQVSGRMESYLSTLGRVSKK